MQLFVGRVYLVVSWRTKNKLLTTANKFEISTDKLFFEAMKLLNKKLYLNIKDFNLHF